MYTNERYPYIYKPLDKIYMTQTLPTKATYKKFEPQYYR